MSRQGIRRQLELLKKKARYMWTASTVRLYFGIFERIVAKNVFVICMSSICRSIQCKCDRAVISILTLHTYIYISADNTRAPLLECRTYLRNCLLQQYRVISIPGQHSQQLHGRRKDNAVSIDIWKYIVQILSSFYAFHKCVCPAFLQTSL